MLITFQILTVIFTVTANLQKDKWKMMLFFSFHNIACVAMYFCFGRITTACICIVALARTLIYMIFALKKIKPNIWILLLFEIGFIISTVLTWQDALDLLPLFALLIVGYASWQDNQLILRIGYILNPILFIIYKMIIGAYISAISEILALISSVVGIIYYVAFKKDVSLFQLVGNLFIKKKDKRIEEN